MTLTGQCHTAIAGWNAAQALYTAAARPKNKTDCAVYFTFLLHLMHPSAQTLVLALTTLAVGGVEGLKFQRRADPIDTSNAQGAQNLLITNADQTLFYTPMQFGSGSEVLNIYGLVSTTR